MARKFLEDMVQAKRARESKTRNTGAGEMRQRETREKETQEWEEREVRESKPVQKRIPEMRTSRNRPRYMLWFVALISVVFLFFAVSYLFSKAEVVVTPKSQAVTLNENLSATKDSTTGLAFDVITISGKQDKTVAASAQKDASIKAVGTVLLYNAYSTAAQDLNVDTRLEGSNGKIYKTSTKTTVPGMNKDGTPGSVQVQIYASDAGASYNSDPLDFKIFGFKGTAKYTKFYGRSQGPIAGGYIGKVPDVSAADQAVALATLKSDLSAKLLQQATDQIPSGFILFKDAVFLNTDPNIAKTYNKDNTMTMTLSGTLDGILFDEKKLTAKIASDVVDKYDGSDVYIPNIRNLSFALANSDTSSLDKVPNINFTLSGAGTIVWRLDENKFISDLLGKSKKNFNQILAQYPNIDSATLTVSPIWKLSVPSEEKNVKLIVNYPK